MKKNILIVDNLPDRIIFFIECFGKHNLDIVENYLYAIDYLENKIYDYIFLGGALRDNGQTCIKIAEFLITNNQNKNNNAEIIIHSWDLVAVDNLLNLLPKAKYLPFNTKTYSNLFNL